MGVVPLYPTIFLYSPALPFGFPRRPSSLPSVLYFRHIQEMKVSIFHTSSERRIGRSQGNIQEAKSEINFLIGLTAIHIYFSTSIFSKSIYYYFSCLKLSLLFRNHLLSHNEQCMNSPNEASPLKEYFNSFSIPKITHDILIIGSSNSLLNEQLN